MEHAIGTKITLEVVEGISCKDCFFNYGQSCGKSHDTKCAAFDRTDHKSIIYKEVKED